MVLPNKIRKVMMDDWLTHNKYKNILKFQDVHYVANITHAFIEELYKFEDDRQKRISMMVSVKLMECFNNMVHTHITYKSEIKNGIQFKAMSHFRNRLVDQPNITYVFKEYIVPKKIWCYVYGPMYLLRFLVRLPYIIVSTSWCVQCNMDFFINYINKMMQFLDDNVDTYFSSIDFIE
uniref:MRG domain-containing protein n=2 Tax=Schizaphis graminum TaxID=13262 RepID=A0A2S2PRU7_SCHGA